VSMSLYWEPVQPPQPHGLGGHPLKGILCRAFTQTDGSSRVDFDLGQPAVASLHAIRNLYDDEQMPEPRRTENREIVQGIDEVLKAIREHGTVRLWTE